MKPSLNHFWRLAFALALIFAFPLAPGNLSTLTAFAAGPTCYVDASASGAATGNSWSDAYTTVQDALADPGCTEIWVGAGVYYPDEGAGQTNDNRASTFQLRNGVALYGGFAGTETSRGQSDPATNVTVLSGDIDQNDTTDANGVVTDTANIHGNNAYRVVTGSGTDNTAVLDGFTITAGQANGVFPDNAGGGMYNDAGSPTLTNVTFSANSGTYVGGMYNESGSPALNNVIFSDNSADGAGGMFNFQSSPTLNNVTFSNNSATRYRGGGMYNYHNSSPALNNVTFSDNSAADDGGGMYNESSSPALNNVTFSNNSAGDNGGGMVNTSSSSPTLTDVTFSNNSAADNGGGMYNYSSSPTLTDVTFSRNSAAEGGGMYNENSNPALTDVTFSDNSVSDYGGGMENYQHSNPTLTNVTFSDNSADLGGGMFNYLWSDPTLNNVTFSDNWAYVAGGMLNIQGSPTLNNVTFSRNSAQYGGGGMYNLYNSSPALNNVTFSGNSASNNGGGMYNENSNPALTNTIIANSAGGDCVNGTNGSIAAGSANNLIEDSAHACGLTNGANGNIIGSDPALGALTDFGGPGKQVFPLQPGSPAIDAGVNANCPATDQRGVTRPVGAACDIGAYEYDAPPVVATHSLQASYTGNGPSSFTVTFNKAVADPAGNNGQDDVTNPANYLLIEKGVNGAADTASCAGGVAGDDVQQTVTTVSYNGATYTSTVTLAGALPAGNYRLYVCGTTSITDPSGNHLNGGADSTYDFTVQSRAASLPETGFPMGQVTILPRQPADEAYAATDLTLEIPSLNVSLPIVGVPRTEDGWNVSWLGQSAGWLEGSAFPTWAGNTVLTAHVWDAFNQPGPFVKIKTLRYGDTIEIHAWGQVYTYEVSENFILWGARNTRKVFQHAEDDELTLITCEGYNPLNGNYLFRRAVRAIRVGVK